MISIINLIQRTISHFSHLLYSINNVDLMKSISKSQNTSSILFIMCILSFLKVETRLRINNCATFHYRCGYMSQL
jgi:hypothetical protein